ncbi:DNA replication licensing factor MCM7, partial [Tanacetum coccineum]
EVYIRASSKGQPFTIREVRASNIGQLVKISGIVTRCSDVKPLMKVDVHTCEECGFEIYQEVNARAIFVFRSARNSLPLYSSFLELDVIAYTTCFFYDTGVNCLSFHASF